MVDTFISYSRKNVDFAEKLFQSLQQRQLSAWVDWQNIPHSAGWWEEIKRGIDVASTFVFVASNESLSSAVCVLELAHAIANGKRIIPVVIEALHFEDAFGNIAAIQPDEILKGMLGGRDLLIVARENRAVIGHINWIFFGTSPQGEAKPYTTSLDELIDAVQTDLAHNRQHARLLVRAREWEQDQHSADLLLIGQEVAEAEAWLAAAQLRAKDPIPTALQQHYIRASREAEDRRRRLLRNLRFGTITFAVVGVIAVMLAIGAFLTSQQAAVQAEKAENREATAVLSLTQVAQEIDQQTARLQALNLSIQASTLFNNGQVMEADAVIQQAVALAPDVPQVRSTLAEISLHPSRPLARLIIREPITAVAFSPDTHSLYFASFAGNLAQWNWQTDTTATLLSSDDFRALLPDPTEPDDNYGANTFVLSADGSRFAICTDRGDIFVYDLPDDHLQLLHSSPERNWNASVAMSADGRFIAAGFDDNRLLIWEQAEEGWQERISTTLDNEHSIRAMALSADGRILAIGSRIGTHFWRWDWQQEAIPQSLPITGVGDTRSLALSADGEQIAFGSLSRTVVQWNHTRQISTSHTGHNDSATQVAFSPDGRYLISGGNDHRIYIWKNEQNFTPLYTLRGPNDWVSALAVSPDSRLIAGGAFDGTLHIWPMQHGALIDEYSGGTFPALTLDGQYLMEVRGSEYPGDLIHWSTDTIIPHSLRFATPHVIVDPVRDLFIAVDSFDLMFESGFAGSPFTLNAFSAWAEASGVMADYAPRPTSLAISPALDRVVLAMDDYVFLWGAAQPQVLTHLPQLKGLRKITFSADGQALYAMNLIDATLHGNSYSLMRYDFASDTLHPVLPAGTAIHDFSLDQQQTTLMIAGSDRTVYVYDLATGQQRHALTGHTLNIRSVSLSADGTRAVSAGEEERVLIWDITAGALLHTLSGHELSSNNGGSIEAAISRNGSRVITLTQGTVREWQIYNDVTDILNYRP